ncbi:MAG: rRNA methyltransferase, partial [Acidobacteriota bacterium]
MAHAVEHISDPADPRLADYAHVGDPGWLRGHGLFVAEGRLVVERLAGAGRFRIRSLLLAPTAHHALMDKIAAIPCPVYLAPRQVMEALTGFSFHQGCLALAERGPALPLSSLEAGRWMLGIEEVGNP